MDWSRAEDAFPGDLDNLAEKAMQRLAPHGTTSGRAPASEIGKINFK